MKVRLKWCLQYRNFDWKSCIFSDEKLFRAGATVVGLRYRKGQRPTVPVKNRSSGSFHIWNAIHLSQRFPIFEVPSHMTAQEYTEILSKAFVGRFRTGMIFQQDNAPSHRALQTYAWLLEHDYDYITFPPYSPDLNVIENLWAIVSYNVRKRQPKSQDELERVVKEEMDKVPQTTIQNLIMSMSRRIEACIEAEGGYFKI